jgi:hypothetical protein
LIAASLFDCLIKHFFVAVIINSQNKKNIHANKNDIFPEAAFLSSKIAEWHSVPLMTRVARFFWVQHTKTGKNIPNDHKIF